MFGRPLKLKVNALTSNDIRNGTTIEIDGAPWRVMGKFICLPFPVDSASSRAQHTVFYDSTFNETNPEHSSCSNLAL